MNLPPVGVQLIVFGGKYDINTDAAVILDSLVRAGYAGVEGGAKDAEMYRRMLDERGLKYCGSHGGLAALDDVKSLAAYVKTLGGADVCNSAMRTWDARSLEDYRDGISVLNKAGHQLRDEGIHLHYHNHAFEFDKVDGEKTGMDLLLDGLDFSVVDLCVDVAWVMRGGANPAEFLRKYNAQIGYLHFKDFDGEDWIELGQGQNDFPSIMQVLPELTGVRWVVTEQDSSKLDPRESIAISRRYLKDAFGY